MVGYHAWFKTSLQPTGWAPHLDQNTLGFFSSCLYAADITRCSRRAALGETELALSLRRHVNPAGESMSSQRVLDSGEIAELVSGGSGLQDTRWSGGKRAELGPGGVARLCGRQRHPSASRHLDSLGALTH